MAKITEVHAHIHRCVHLTCSYSFCLCKLIIFLSPSVTQSQAVIEPPDSNSRISSTTSSGGAHTGYELHQQPFNSSTGSGYTIWYSSRSDSSIHSPLVISQSTTEHLYVHFDALRKTYQYWMLGINGQWESVSKNAENPLIHDQVLSNRSNGEPSWVMRATISTMKTRWGDSCKVLPPWPHPCPLTHVSYCGH